MTLNKMFFLKKNLQNRILLRVNPVPDMSILDSSNLAANKDMISKISTNRDTVI